MKTGQLGPGTILGRYELLLPIASGGMATVWVARSRGSRGFSKTVAIKTILPNLSDDPTFEQMFLDEAAIASRIQHPNVAQIIDLGEQDEVLYLAMEWVDGESLSTLSKFARKNGTDIPIRVGLKMMSQACAGVHAAHELRDDDDRLLELVHRDISPQNILISSSGIVKIVDFGVAKALGRTGETSAGQLKGKVPFMSPEQAKGGKVDRRTDVFALGIILYRIATGAHPFLDENDIKTMRNIISRPVMPPRVKTPSVPVELERTILKALQKDPDKRHASAADLETEIEAVMQSSFGAVPIDEVATFVRATLGERDRKRRAAIRDAAIKMDETAGAGSLVPSGGAPTIVGPAPQDSVSGVMLTQTQTPPTTISGSDAATAASAAALAAQTVVRAQQPGDVTVVGSIGGADAAGDEVTRAFELGPSLLAGPASERTDATPTRLSDPLIGTSPTLAAVAAAGPFSARSPGTRNKTLAIAAAIGCGLGVGALLIVKLGGSGAPLPAGAGEPRGERQTQVAPAKAAEAAQSATSDLPPSAAPTEASAQADATGVGTDIDLNELPDSDAGKKPRAGGPGAARARGSASAKAGATQGPAAPPPTTAATSKPPSGPTVQDPGF